MRFIDEQANEVTGANAGGRRWLSMRTRWAARIAQFWRSAAMRALLLLPCLMLAGCEGTKELGVIPAHPGTNTVIRSVLPRTAHCIWFSSPAPLAGNPELDRVTVTLTNRSGKRTISFQKPGAWVVAPPHTGIQLFEGSLSTLLSEERFHVTTWEGRASCELHIHFWSTPSLSAPIRALCWYSSPPL